MKKLFKKSVILSGAKNPVEHSRWLFLGIASACFAVLAMTPMPAKAADIDLFWHTNTLVPDDYAGRSLPIRGSMITVTAISEGNYKSLNYDWYLDGNYIRYSSGSGKNSFSFRVTEWPGFSHTIQTKTGEKYSSLSIDIVEPEVDLGARQYIMSPGESKTIRAVPYYFSSNNLKYNWSFNNKKVNEDGNILILDIAPDSYAGERKLDVTVSNSNNLLERARRRIIIKIE